MIRNDDFSLKIRTKKSGNPAPDYHTCEKTYDVSSSTNFYSNYSKKNINCQRKRFFFTNVFQKNTQDQKTILRHIQSYCSDVLHPEKSTLCFIGPLKSGQHRSTLYTKSLHNSDKMEHILRTKDHRNLGISLNSYYLGSRTPKTANLSCLNAFCVDIDFRKNPRYEYWDADRIFDILLEFDFCDLPYPDYVEIGNQLRLIYVFAEPVFLPKKDQKTRAKILTLYKRISKYFADTINQELSLFAEVQRATSFIRLPYSYNSKQKDCMIRVIQINGQNERRTMREYMEEVLPPLEEWYRPWNNRRKTKKKKGKKAIAHYVELKQHNQMVLEDLRKIQKYRGKGYRETLCFLYFCYQILDGQAEEKALEEVFSFNQQFDCPLKTNELTTSLRHTAAKQYRFRNATILEMVGMDLDFAKEIGLSIAIPKRRRKKNSECAYYQKRKRKKIREGKTRKQIAERRMLEAQNLLDQGLSVKVVAKLLQISTRQIHNYRNIGMAKKMEQKRAAEKIHNQYHILDNGMLAKKEFDEKILTADSFTKGDSVKISEGKVMEEKESFDVVASSFLESAGKTKKILQ